MVSQHGSIRKGKDKLISMIFLLYESQKSLAAMASHCISLTDNKVPLLRHLEDFTLFHWQWSLGTPSSYLGERRELAIVGGNSTDPSYSSELPSYKFKVLHRVFPCDSCLF